MFMEASACDNCKLQLVVQGWSGAGAAPLMSPRQGETSIVVPRNRRYVKRSICQYNEVSVLIDPC